MVLHAIRTVGDAFAVTRSFLFPFDWRAWFKLAVVAFFVGGATSLPSGQFDAAQTPADTPIPEVTAPFDVELLPILVAVVAVVVVLGIAFALVGAILEFVLVESLRSGDVSMRRYWHRRWRQGVRLFGFRLAIGIPFLALVVGWVGLFIAPLAMGVVDPTISVGMFLMGLPFLFVLGILYALVYGFTTVFVVPIMILEDVGVLGGWRRLWSSIRAEWKQYLAYAVLAFVLTIATGLLASLMLGLAAVVLLAPLGLVVAIVYLTVGITSTAGIGVLAVLALVFLVAMAVCWALVQVPILVYLRYYALLVLGDVEPTLDLVPERRRAARE